MRPPTTTCADPENVFRGGQTLPMFYFLEGERIQIPLKADQYRPASETPFKWRFAGGSMMAQHNTLDAGLKALSFSGDPDQYC